MNTQMFAYLYISVVFWDPEDPLLHREITTVLPSSTIIGSHSWNTYSTTYSEMSCCGCWGHSPRTCDLNDTEWTHCELRLSLISLDSDMWSSSSVVNQHPKPEPFIAYQRFSTITKDHEPIWTTIILKHPRPSSTILDPPGIHPPCRTPKVPLSPWPFTSSCLAFGTLKAGMWPEPSMAAIHVMNNHQWLERG